MSSLFSIFDIAASSLTAQSVRLNTTASNLANAESGSSSADKVYKPKQPVFGVQPNATSSLFDTNTDINSSFSSSDLGSKVQVQQILESSAKPRSSYEPNNPIADAQGMVYYPNINVVQQMTDMISASRSFQANVEVLTTTLTLMDKTRSLGEQ